MTLKKIIRKLKLKFYDANQNIPKIIGQYNLIGSFLALAGIDANALHKPKRFFGSESYMNIVNGLPSSIPNALLTFPSIVIAVIEITSIWVRDCLVVFLLIFQLVGNLEIVEPTTFTLDYVLIISHIILWLLLMLIMII